MGQVEIDAALRLVDREIWIITAADGPRRGGLVATWVTNSSIDPQRPVLVAGLGPNHFTTELVQSSRAFAAHLLRPEQVELAWNFAKDSGRVRDKLAGLESTSSSGGAQLLADCLAWFDCRVFGRYNAGDRLYFWADIVASKVVGTLRVPSADHGTRSVPTTLREQAFFSQLTDDQRKHLLAARDADAAALRPLHDQWRNLHPW